MKHLSISAALLIVGISTAFATGETPAYDGSSTATPTQPSAETRTPVQLALSDQTPDGSKERPAKPNEAKGEGDKVTVLTHEQICGVIYRSYSQALLQDPMIENTKNGTYNGFSGLAGTVARHTTLQRLATIAMAQNCDPVPMLSLEDRVINQTYTSPRVR